MDSVESHCRTSGCVLASGIRNRWGCWDLGCLGLMLQCYRQICCCSSHCCSGADDILLDFLGTGSGWALESVLESELGWQLGSDP